MSHGFPLGGHMLSSCLSSSSRPPRPQHEAEPACEGRWTQGIHSGVASRPTWCGRRPCSPGAKESWETVGFPGAPTPAATQICSQHFLRVLWFYPFPLSESGSAPLMPEMRFGLRGMSTLADLIRSVLLSTRARTLPSADLFLLICLHKSSKARCKTIGE